MATVKLTDKELATAIAKLPEWKVVDGKLNMSVLMRSNDLWYGFCNDQFCFSKLQIDIADILQLEVGTYYHFAHNLHLYNDKL
jgi:thymidylate synthase